MYWSACEEALSPAGATGEERSACVEKAKAEGGSTDELGAGICCHTSGFEEPDRRYSHG